MSISERVTDHWPLTEEQLISQTSVFYERAKDRAMSDSIADLYRAYSPAVPIPDIDDVDALGSDLIERYLAAKTIIKLIPMARDHYMQERLSKSQSANFGGAISASYVKKVDELDDLYEAMSLEIRSLESLVGDVISPVAPHPGYGSNAPIVSFPADRVVDPLFEYNRRMHRRRS